VRRLVAGSKRAVRVDVICEAEHRSPHAVELARWQGGREVGLDPFDQVEHGCEQAASFRREPHDGRARIVRRRGQIDVAGPLDLAQQLAGGLPRHAGARRQDTNPGALDVEIRQERRSRWREVVEAARMDPLDQTPVVHAQRSRQRAVQARVPVGAQRADARPGRRGTDDSHVSRHNTKAA